MYTKDTSGVILVYGLCPFVCMYMYLQNNNAPYVLLKKKEHCMTIAEVACIQRTDGVKSIQCHIG